MRLRVLAIGTRMPAWAAAACEDYARRLPASMPLVLAELASGRNREDEGRRLLSSLTERERPVALDERGTLRSSADLAEWLEAQRRVGKDLCFIVGGADGLAADVMQRCGERLSLSPLTLPHALARVLLIEQLYRASSILAGHPYHRA
jgi:23S rRNA (pseudouridine1915-N3)-methyltransferase